LQRSPDAKSSTRLRGRYPRVNARVRCGIRVALLSYNGNPNSHYCTRKCAPAQPARGFHPASILAVRAYFPISRRAVPAADADWGFAGHQPRRSTKQNDAAAVSTGAPLKAESLHEGIDRLWRSAARRSARVGACRREPFVNKAFGTSFTAGLAGRRRLALPAAVHCMMSKNAGSNGGRCRD
jgi:hypothetical protein